MGKSWIQLIKKIAADERKASKPCDVCIGRMISVSPVTVQLDQKKVLDEDFLIIPARITRMIEIGILKRGSAVLMIQADGGQEYAVLDLVRDGDT